MEIIGTIKLGLQFRNGIVPLPKCITLWFYFSIANTSLHTIRSDVLKTDIFRQRLLMFKEFFTFKIRWISENIYLWFSVILIFLIPCNWNEINSVTIFSYINNRIATSIWMNTLFRLKRKWFLQYFQIRPKIQPISGFVKNVWKKWKEEMWMVDEFAFLKVSRPDLNYKFHSQILTIRIISYHLKCPMFRGLQVIC